MVARLREAIPKSVFLRLDAKKGYGLLTKQLAGIVRRLESAGVDAIEQPASTVYGLRACREAVSVPITGHCGRSLLTARGVLDLRDARAVDAVSVYVAKAGGMERAADVARMAAETLTLPSIIPVPSSADQRLTHYAGRYWEDDLLESGFSFRDGCLCIADAPGLGIKVDRRKVDKFAVGDSRMSRP